MESLYLYKNEELDIYAMDSTRPQWQPSRELGPIERFQCVLQQGGLMRNNSLTYCYALMKNDPKAEHPQEYYWSKLVSEMDVILGSGFQAAFIDSKIRPVALTNELTLYYVFPMNERICVDNLWSWHHANPCRSYAGLQSLWTKRVIENSLMRRFDVAWKVEDADNLTMRSMVGVLPDSDPGFNVNSEVCANSTHIFLGDFESAEDQSARILIRPRTKIASLISDIRSHHQFGRFEYDEPNVHRDELGIFDLSQEMAGKLQFTIDNLLVGQNETYRLLQKFPPGYRDFNSSKEQGDFVELSRRYIYEPETEQYTLDLEFIPAEKSLVFSEAYTKGHSSWSRYPESSEGGWLMENCILLKNSEPAGYLIAAFGSNDVMSRFVLMDLTAFFNGVSFAIFAFIMLYSRFVRSTFTT